MTTKKKKLTTIDDHGDDEARWLERLNAQYCVVQDGGRIDVLTFERLAQKIGAYEHVRHVPAFLTFAAFRNKYLNQSVMVAGNNGAMTPTNVGAWWLKHLRRRQYDGLIFQPGGDAVIDGRLNLWKGWGVEPKPGDWSLMQEHIRTVLAAGNEEIFTYDLNWLAFAVQQPEQRAEVALVCKGKRGTGKGTLGNAMVRIFGQHGVHLSDARHLTGNFNAHLRTACFLFADESYWPGDKSAEGNLKRLITEPDLAIEAKNRDIVMVPNMLHVLMGSNEKWVAPAGEHERRFAVSEVADCHIQEKKWFDELYRQLEHGGYAAMLYDLLYHDIDGWHPRQFPRTEALLEQQRLSLDPFEQWWIELLEGGTLEGADPYVPNQAVSNMYEREVVESDSYGGKRKRYVRQPGLYDQARTISPRLRAHASDHALGHFLVGQDCISKKVLQRRGWRFPDLIELRRKWETRFPDWPWRNSKISEWQAPPDAEDNNNDDE